MGDSFRSTPRRADVGAIDAGAHAELLAAEFLVARGLAMVARNFRTRFGEIDVIARESETLVFVEVRKRRSDAYGRAATSITAAKRARLTGRPPIDVATLQP